MEEWLKELEGLSRELIDYPLAVEEFKGELIHLDRNENYFIPREFIAKLAFEAVEEVDLRRYPVLEERELEEKIGDFHSLPRDRVVVGNGSDELIYMACQLLARIGGALIIQPTFQMYKWCLMRFGVNPVEVLLNEDFTLSVEKILHALSSEVKLLFICSPNNPTGGVVEEKIVRELASKFNGLILVDEAYADFSERSLIELVNEYDNLAVLRSFSKVGLAGLRIGYLIADPRITRTFRKFLMPFHLNKFTLTLTSKFLDEYELVRKWVRELIAERERLYRELKRFKELMVFPSKANFLLVKLMNHDLNEVYRRLLSKGVKVRRVDSLPLLENCFRVTVGLREMNEVFIEKLREALNEV